MKTPWKSYHLLKKNFTGLIFFILCCIPMYSQVPYTIPTIKGVNDFGLAIYIDPSQSVNGNGTFENPFNSFSDIEIQTNTAYLIKAGTILNESINKTFNNNYMGRYGEGGNPIITSNTTVLDLNNTSKNVTFNNLIFSKTGNANYDQIIRLSDNGDEGIVLANLKVFGQNNGSGYPYYCMKGSAKGMVLYHCEFSYCSNDGWYSSQFENVKIVSNYFHHQNMGGINVTNSTGDGIQMENATASNLYFANNYMDRSHTIWKFALIINSTLDLSSEVVCEWNTFISPKAGNGGAAVRWLAGSNNTFTKNLINTVTGVSGIDGYDEHLNQVFPYGVRDNHAFGSGELCTQYLQDTLNKKFDTKLEYEAFLNDSGIIKYGSDIEPDSFWNEEQQSNTPPLAHAGYNITVMSNDTVILDGSKSSDPDGDTITYYWTTSPGISLSSDTVVKPIFTAPEVTQNTMLEFSLVVFDGKLYSDTAKVTITVKPIPPPNSAPIANAGSNKTVNSNDTVILDGSNSSDPDGDTIKYDWTTPPEISLSSDTVVKPMFIAPEVTQDSMFEFSLVVFDGELYSDTAKVKITVKPIPNSAPIANAGNNKTVSSNDTVILNGSNSSDPDEDIITYTWIAPNEITLSSNNVAKPVFTAPQVIEDTTFEFSLIVFDGELYSDTAKVTITVKFVPPPNHAPIANAGNNIIMNGGDLVTLNGSASYDPDEDTITYYWTAPNEITLFSNTAIKPTFIAPEADEDKDFNFSLKVFDGKLYSTVSNVTITILKVEQPTNYAPVANVCKDSTVNIGDTVTLDGSKSSDINKDLLTFNWISPVEINLSPNNVVKPTFVAPEVVQDTAFEFALVVFDGELYSDTAKVTITVKIVPPPNLPPIANAGNDTTVNSSDIVILDGSDSSDPDNDSIEYIWTVPTGIILSSNTVVNPTFTAPYVTQETAYKFYLQVFDGQLISSQKSEVLVTVHPPLFKENGKLLEINNITASDNDGNIPENTLDKSLETRWSAEGTGQWISLELASPDSLKYIKTAWYKGNERHAYFDVQLSMDGVLWETILSYNTSSGQTNEYEIINIADRKTKFVRLVGFGNSENNWISITEIELYGIPNNTSGIKTHKLETLIPFPNPTTGNFNINISSIKPDKGKLIIINTLGQIVYEKYIIDTPNLQHVNLNSYPNGMYIIKCIDTQKNLLIGKSKILLLNK